MKFLVDLFTIFCMLLNTTSQKYICSIFSFTQKSIAKTDVQINSQEVFLWETA